MSTLNVNVWPGDWGLPSVDIECIRFLGYLKITHLGTVNIVKTGNPLRSPGGRMPAVALASKTINTFDDLVSFVNSKNVNPDHGLSERECSEIAAYTTMLEDKLFPALQYFLWVDKSNHDTVIAPCYNRITTFPFNLYYPKKFQRVARQSIESLYEHLDNENEIMEKVVHDAEKCLTALSIRLGDKEFMFGSRTSSLDATLFAYLAPLAKIPFKSIKLQNHLKACTNLMRFIQRFGSRYFPEETNAYEVKRKEEVKQSKEDPESNFPHKRRNQILMILTTLIAMMGYAVTTGLVQIPDWVYPNESANQVKVRLKMLWNWRKFPKDLKVDQKKTDA